MLVHSKDKLIRHIGDVRLIPGMNELSGSDIEVFIEGMKVPLSKALENQGGIEVPDQPQKGKTKDSVGFSELAANKTVRSIADTFDLELSEKWLEEKQADKNRITVVKAIENQVDGVKNPDEGGVVSPKQEAVLCQRAQLGVLG